MSTPWSTPTRYIAAVTLALLGVLVLYLSRSVIPTLIIATLIAVIVQPVIRWLTLRARMPRGLAVTLVYLVFIFLVPVVVALALPAIINAVQFVLDLDYRQILQNILDWLRGSLTNLIALQFPLTALDNFIDQTAGAVLEQISSQPAASALPATSSLSAIFRSIGAALTATLGTAAGLIGTLFSQLALFIFLFLSSVYISLDAHKFHDSFLGLIPARYRPEMAVLLARIGRMWAMFFRGELTLMLLIGLISWLGLTILGVPGALYLGIVAGLLELIPNLGPILATVPAVIVALLQGSTYLPVSHLVMALIVIGFYLLVQQLENNLIVPRVLGGAVELPALVVMTGVLVGANIAGLMGALLATPVIASARIILGYVYRKILAEDPFPPDEEPPKPTPLLETVEARLARWTDWARARLGRPPLNRARPVDSAPPDVGDLPPNRTPDEKG